MQSQTNRPRIVCLGGSAGALPAYLEILGGVPDDLGMAFVIIAHRGEDNADLLPQLLSRATKMRVVEIQHGMRLEPNIVFLAPPNEDVTTTGSALETQPKSKPSGWPNAITVFLKSMAATVGKPAVAVILSGMGCDGSAGLAAVKAAGGRVFAQSNAPYNSMPTNAIETGQVDRVLTPTQIAAELCAISTETTEADRQIGSNNTSVGRDAGR